MNSSSSLYFNEVADQWDNMRTDFFSEVVREKAYAIASVESGKTAADIGAGTGFLTEGLINQGVNVIAVDYSIEMLNQMMEKFKSYDCIQYKQGTSNQLPIESGQVDYAMANMYLHHVEDPLTAIKEMARILKPSGKLIITDLDRHHFEFLRLEHHDRWMGFDRSDIKNWFEAAGLHNVKVDCIGSNCCATSENGCDSASISIFIAYGEK